MPGSGYARSAVAASAGFAVLLILVAVGWAPLERFDAAVSDAFRGYGQAHQGWVSVLRVGTDAAHTVPYFVVGLGAAVALAILGDRRRAVATVAVVLSVWLLWTLGHAFVYRPRPVDGFVPVAAYGFPSGHASNAATLAVLAVWLLWSRFTRAGRVALAAASVTFAGFVGLTRVALLAHYPADVFGAWLLVLAVFLPLARLVRAPAAPPYENTGGHVNAAGTGAGRAVRSPPGGGRVGGGDRRQPLGPGG